MLVAVRYDRVSKDEEKPAEHLAGLRALALDRGFEAPPGLEFFDYVTGDPVRRGKEPPGLRRAIDEVARLGKRGVLVIRSAERLVRSPVELINTVARVQGTGGHVVSRDDGADLDTTSDMGELMLFIRGWFSRMALKFTRKMTTGALKDRKRQIAERGGFVVTGKNSKRRGEFVTSLGRPRGMTEEALARALYLRTVGMEQFGVVRRLSWGEIAGQLRVERLGDYRRGAIQRACGRAVAKRG